MAHISGIISEEAKIIVLDSNHNKIKSANVSAGNYIINDILTLSGTVIAVSNSGEVIGYHSVNYISDIDSYTKLLLHFDESPLIDSSPSAKTLSLYGSVARSATQSKFGSYSGYLNGTSQYMVVADSPDWDFGTSDFTIDFWFYATSIQNGTTLFARRSGEGIGPFYLGINDGTGFPSPYLYFYSSSNGTSWDVASNAGGGPYTANSWKHIAIIRNGNTMTFYNNGASVNSFNVTGKSFDGNQPFCIGALDNGSYKFTGYIDEYRISKGIARWTSNFTPPTSAYL